MPPDSTRAEFFRREAVRLRRLAEFATLTEVRSNLMRTVRLYEAQVRRADGDESPLSEPGGRDAQQARAAAALRSFRR